MTGSAVAAAAIETCSVAVGSREILVVPPLTGSRAATDYIRYLAVHLPEPYMASRDMKLYMETLNDVAAGTLTVKDAMHRMPKLKRVGGTCPCSKSVRWVMEEPTAAHTNGA